MVLTPALAYGLIVFVCLLFSLCVHEAAHAVAAEWRGDTTPRFMGRVTLNPLAHIDYVGTIILPLILVVSGSPMVFGWAKPVPFNPRNLKNIRGDSLLIAMAGPLSNFALAVVVLVVLRVALALFGFTAVESSPFWTFAILLIQLNILLMCFNLIPVPPLDGHYLLSYLLPPAGARFLDSVGPFGLLIAILVARTVLHIPLDFLTRLFITVLLWGVRP